VRENAARIVRSLAIYAILLGIVGICVPATLAAMSPGGMAALWIAGMLSGALVAGGGLVLVSVPRPPRELRTKLPAARIIQR
jgi:hypothetical protein